jgi:hypothetical protein
MAYEVAAEWRVVERWRVALMSKTEKDNHNQQKGWTTDEIFLNGRRV